MTPVDTYELKDVGRIHNGYTPAVAPVSITLNVISVNDENAEFTLAGVLLPLHELDAITNADMSLETFTKPAPLTTMVCGMPLTIGITLGVREMIPNTPASTYGDPDFHRTHN